MLQLGDTLLLSHPQAKEHLHIVIYRKDRVCYLVNLTRMRPNCDPSCVIRAGEHRFVKTDSIALYQLMEEVKDEDYSELEDRILDQYERVSDDLLERLQKGAVRSRFTAKKFKDAIAEVIGSS